MSYRIAAIMGETIHYYTIPALVDLASGDTPPVSVTLPYFKIIDHLYYITEGDGLGFVQSADPALYRAINILTCAAICFVNPSTNRGYVYHASQGVISPKRFRAILKYLAGPASSLFVAYAHPGPHHSTYQSEIDRLIEWGVPSHQIIEITEVNDSCFAMNHLLELGF